MATESLPTTGAMSLENYLFDPAASVGAVSEVVSRFPRANVADPRRSVYCRSTGTGNYSFDLDLGQERSPTLLALIDANIGTNDEVILMSLDAIGGSILQTWTFASYSAGRGDGSLGGAVIRFYLGADNSSVAMTGSRYWRVQFRSVGGIVDFDRSGVVDTTLRVGTIWLGRWVEMPFRPGARVKVTDPSRIVESIGGARFSDRQRIAREGSLELDYTPIATVYDQWLTAFESVGESSPVLIDLEATSTVATRKAHGCYYATIQAEIGYDFALHGTARLSFAEVRG